MIASWMLHAVLVSTLLALAARAAESALAAYRLPVRWAWVGAALGSLALPAAAAADLTGRAAAWLSASAPAGGGASLTSPGGAAGATPPAAPAGALTLPALPAAVDSVALAAWIGGSLLLGGLAVRSWLALRRRSRGWERATVDGVDVLVSEETGPAAVGFLDPVLVLPDWARRLPSGERRLVLRHELEHREARDPAILSFGVAALLAAPWNPALWWIVRRLRLGVELDCDRRVLESGASPGDYGGLLLEITRDRKRGPLPAAALGERSSQLEKRIRAMTDPIPTFRTVRTALLALTGAGLLAVACDAPEFVPRDADPRATNDDEIRRLLKVHAMRLKEEHPETDITGTATVWMFVDRDGQVGKVQMQESSGREPLDRAATSVASRMEFDPARRDGKPIGVWVSRRITISADDADVAAGSEPPSTAQTLKVWKGTDVDLSAKDTPLIYLDGERVDKAGVLHDLNTDRIESIEVLKGPAAAELYGEEARNGVIRITTKSSGDSGS